ncbi:MAG: type II secretion system major pseudopilin GspG [Candidatus Omnitrophica bacterium]|nr:type II secretion system major pseudopilin GspG [Candidatus Omnitrophota bacterium]
MRYFKEKNEGFTIMEIMLVIIIIAALTAMAAPNFIGQGERAKRRVAEADVNANIPTALKLYELDNGVFPTTEQGLSALWTKPSSSPVPTNWNGPYLDQKPKDPWGNAYIYASPGVNHPFFDLSSQGRDMESDEDNITNWKDE